MLAGEPGTGTGVVSDWVYSGFKVKPSGPIGNTTPPPNTCSRGDVKVGLDEPEI